MVCFCKCLRLLHWRQRSESSSLRFFSEVHLRIFLLISSTYSIKYEPRISEGICQITVEDLYLQTFHTNVVKISFLVYNASVTFFAETWDRCMIPQNWNFDDICMEGLHPLCKYDILFLIFKVWRTILNPWQASAEVTNYETKH